MQGYQPQYHVHDQNRANYQVQGHHHQPNIVIPPPPVPVYQQNVFSPQQGHLHKGAGTQHYFSQVAPASQPFIQPVQQRQPLQQSAYHIPHYQRVEYPVQHQHQYQV